MDRSVLLNPNPHFSWSDELQLENFYRSDLFQTSEGSAENILGQNSNFGKKIRLPRHLSPVAAKQNESFPSELVSKFQRQTLLFLPAVSFRDEPVF